MLPVILADAAPGSRISRALGPYAVGAAMALALVTFVIFAGLTPIVPTNFVVLSILGGDALVVLILLVLILLELGQLRKARRAARAGARLHSRVVALFSLVAAIPAIVTAVVATVSVERAINPDFMKNVANFVADGGAAAQLYRESQCQGLLRDAQLTARDLGRGAKLLQTDPKLFQDYLNERAKILEFPAAAILNSDGEVLRIAVGSDGAKMAQPRPEDFADAAAGRSFCGLLNNGASFIVLRPIDGIDKGFFYAARDIDPRAARVASDAVAFTGIFSSFETHQRNLELGFATVFILLALTMLISAVWLGLTFANQLVNPIRRLIRATDAVASGDLYVQVPTRKSEGDLGHLGDTFNKMTSELRSQHESLIAANALNDERRAFIEAALSGVPAGVIGVDKEGAIGVVNAAAERLLAADGAMGSLPGKKLAEAFPKLGQILADSGRSRTRLHQAQTTMISNGRERLLNVRVTGDPQRPDQGAVMTLDDITDLVSAQRSAAWADVARRIAHEIKNPLTPIQLSAERLKRRYGRHIVEGKEIFDQCTDTIIRQVDDIKRMVDEFSNFARMPTARLTRDDLTDCVRQAVFLARVGRADLVIEEDLPAEPVWAEFDRRLVSQALTNILKNAGEGIDALPERSETGRIRLALSTFEGQARISVSDNGKGFPAQDRNKLTEPYVTTRAEGTGLGLPIVIKIFEDHHGDVALIDGLERADGGRGAQVLMTFPLSVAAKPAASAAISEKAGS